MQMNLFPEIITCTLYTAVALSITSEIMQLIHHRLTWQNMERSEKLLQHYVVMNVLPCNARGIRIMPKAKMKALFSTDRVFITENNQISRTGIYRLFALFVQDDTHTHTKSNKTGNWKQDNWLWVLLLPYYPRPPNPLITSFVYPFLHFPQAVSKRNTVVSTLYIKEA